LAWSIEAGVTEMAILRQRKLGGVSE
jgi:hypothetical protein